MISLVVLVVLSALASLVFMGPRGGPGQGGRGQGGGQGGRGQGGGGQGGQGGGQGGQAGRVPPWRVPLATLRNPGLHDELQLTDEQKGQLDQVLRELGERVKGDAQALQGLEPAVRRGKVQELTLKVIEEVRKVVFPFLRPAQQKRLQEIQLQLRGPRAFADPPVQVALRLSAEQIKQVAAIIEEIQKEAQELAGQGQEKDNPQEMRPRAAGRRKANLEKMLALLSAEQKTNWQTMTGKPFQVRQASPGSGSANEGPELLSFDGDF